MSINNSRLSCFTQHMNRISLNCGPYPMEGDTVKKKESKKQKQAKNGIAGAKPTSTNQDLISVSASPRAVTVNQPIWNYLVSSREVICHIDPFYFPENDEIIPHFSYPSPLLPLQGVHFIQTFRAPVC